MKKLRIAMMSFADINNYGDILFSHIVSMELKNRLSDVQIDFFTPSTIDLEGIHYEGYKREKIDNQYDGILLAGGEVVHLFDDRTWVPIYKKQNKKVESKLASDTVWDWIDCRADFKAWVSVGVRPFENKWDRLKVHNAITALDYISCRGILSKKILEGGDLVSYNKKITITPDLGWIFPKYLDYLGERGKKYVTYINSGLEYLLFQVHNINVDEAKFIANRLLRIKNETGLQIVMMPVIHLWQDEIFLSQINEFAGNQFIMLPKNLSILEMLDVVVHSRLTITSSLHIAITALAQGIPASVFNKWQGTKLQDLYGLQFRTEYLFSDVFDFNEIFEKLEQERANPNSLLLYSDFMKEKLKSTFDCLADKLRIR